MYILCSGTGTIFGQGWQDRERQSWEREIKVRIQVSGGKSRPGGPKYLQGGKLPPAPLLPAPMIL